MIANDGVASLAPEVVSWRHEIHRNPELGFNEICTAAFIAGKLKFFGLDVHTDVSATGVVAVLKAGSRERAIALRAEMDALPICEKADVPYASANEGVMHACGHSAILLGAAADGAYAWIGAGDVGPGEGLHGDRYVFNDDLVPVGMRYWLSLVARELPQEWC